MRWHHSGLPGPPPSPAVTLQDADDTAGHNQSVREFLIYEIYFYQIHKVTILYCTGYNHHIQWLQKVRNL